MHVFDRALRDRRIPIMWWSIGVAIYCAFIVAVWPVIEGNDDFEELYADMPDALQAMFGADGFTDFTSPAGFLNTYLFSMILPFIFTGLAISFASSLLPGEEEDELLDLVLSYPIRRRDVLLEKALALATAVAMLAIVVVVLLAVAREPVDLDIGVGGLASATLGSVLFALFHGFAALAAGAATGAKGVATGVGWGLALAGYLINIIANLDDSLDWLEPFSPMYWATADSPVTGTVPITYAVLAAGIGVLVGSALVLFERHDL